MNIKYLIETSDFLSEKESNILTYFYQPIIGTAAVALYRFLFSESSLGNNNFKDKHSFDRILKFLNLTDEQAKKSIENLTSWSLLEVNYNKKDLDHFYFFMLKKPLSVIQLFKNKSYYKKISQQLSPAFLESAYLKLRNLKFNFQEHDVEHSQLIFNNSFDVNQFITKWSIIKFPNLLWAKDEVLAIEIVQNKYKLDNQTLEIIIDYIIEKNQGLKMETNYFMKIVEDLQNRQMLNNKEELLLYFTKIRSKAKKSYLKIKTPGEKGGKEELKNIDYLFD